MNHHPEERPLSELIADAGKQTAHLFKQEIELAKAEASYKLSRATKHAVMVAGGAFVAYTGALSLVAALILALSRALPAWSAALIIGAALGALGYALLTRALHQLQGEDAQLTQTKHSVQRDVQMLKESMT